MPYISKITLYPFKSLDGCEVERATLLASSALQWDRTFVLVDQQGFYVNGKRDARVHQLRTFFDLKEYILSIQIGQSTERYTFHIDNERTQLAAWFSEYFDQPISIQQNTTHGFPDDVIAPGPTLIGARTLESVASWFPEAEPATFRRRFRANLEIADAEPFWEDCLYGEAETVVSFRVGSVLIEGTNPCKRCIVPSRDPENGEVQARFQKTFVEKRKESLPAWANRSRFDNFYRLAVNTRVPSSEAGKELHLGDQIELL